MQESPLRILVVDDEATHRKLIRHALQQYYPAASVSDVRAAEPALAELRRQAYDAVVLDYMLPDLNALQVLPRLLEIDPDLIVVVTTAHGDEQLATEIMKAGAADYVVKSQDLRQRLPLALETGFATATLRRQTRQAQEQVEHLNAVLLAIRSINKLITTEDDQERLLRRGCEILAHIPGYHGAWIVLLDPEQRFQQGFSACRTTASATEFTIDGSTFPWCITAPLRTPESVNVLTDPNLCLHCPWGPPGESVSIYAVALTCHDRLFGIIGIAVASELIGDPEEENLLFELAGDLAFGLHAMELAREQRRTREDLMHLTSLYAVLSQINEMIVRVRDRDLLFTETCRILVDEGEFLFAWIGLVDPETRLVNPAAFWGQNDGYLDTILVSIEDIVEGCSPTGRCIRDSMPCVSNDIEVDPTMVLWAKEARRRGFHSLASVPLQVDGNTTGALTIYAGEPFFFDERRLALLQALAADLSFAIESLGREARRQRTQEALRRSVDQFRQLVESAPVGIVISRDFEVLYANPSILARMGYSNIGELPGNSLAACVAPECLDLIHKWIEQPQQYPIPEAFEVVGICKNGERVPFYVEIASITFDEDPATISFYTDVSTLKQVEESLRFEVAERRQAQEQLLVYQAELRRLAAELGLAEERERRRVATELHDTVVQLLAFAKMKLGLLKKLPRPPELVEPLVEVEDLVQEAITCSRTLMYELSTSALYEIGFRQALETLVAQAHKRHGLEISFSADDDAQPSDSDVQVLLFQVVRELLNNIGKHAQARHADIHLYRQGEQIVIVVSDDGVGFNTCQIGNVGLESGVGLFSIQERLRHLGGTFGIASVLGQGSHITVTAPLGIAGRQSREKDDPE